MSFDHVIHYDCILGIIGGTQFIVFVGTTVLRIVLDCLLFFVTTSQGILPCGFMSPWPELCSACDTVQYFLAHSVGASLLNSMHCLSCYSVHYRCSWYISLHWTKKKTASALCKFLKLPHCQFSGIAFVSIVMCGLI